MNLPPLDPETLVALVKAAIALAAILGLVIVLVAALARPTGPVTIHARDITVRQEASLKIE